MNTATAYRHRRPPPHPAIHRVVVVSLGQGELISAALELTEIASLSRLSNSFSFGVVIFGEVAAALSI